MKTNKETKSEGEKGEIYPSKSVSLLGHATVLLWLPFKNESPLFTPCCHSVMSHVCRVHQD